MVPLILGNPHISMLPTKRFVQNSGAMKTTTGEALMAKVWDVQLCGRSGFGFRS